MKPYIYPYKMSSNGAKLLAKSLKTKRLFPDGNFVPKANCCIINWGNSQSPIWGNHKTIQNGSCVILNHWDKIRVSSNKLSSLQVLKANNVPIPEFTTDKSVAKNWIKEGNIVVCRKILNGHSGAGIVIAEKESEIVEAPLYTKYFKRKFEFRIVVFGDKIIDVCQKKKKSDAEVINTFIRCNHNGYVYAYNDINPPKQVKDIAISAMKALKLDFGSADVAYNEKLNKAIVFECNSSAGFSSDKSPAFKKYLEAFKNLLTT